MEYNDKIDISIVITELKKNIYKLGNRYIYTLCYNTREHNETLNSSFSIQIIFKI